MKTIKPISTISYNHVAYLEDKLKSDLENGLIAYWQFIKHIGEGEDKDHIHVYIEPANRIDTIAYAKTFNELDPSNAKPLGVMPFKNSKWWDWHYYGLHNRAYLSSKGLTRTQHYELADMVTSDPLDMRERIATEKKPKDDLMVIAENASKGISIFETARQLGIKRGEYPGLAFTYNEIVHEMATHQLSLSAEKDKIEKQEQLEVLEAVIKENEQ